MIRLATHAMGTRFEIVLPGEESPWLRAIGEEAVREIELWHSRLTRFQPDSDVAGLNLRRTARLDDESYELLSLCEQVHGATNGAFNIGLGAVMDGTARATAVGHSPVHLDPSSRTVTLSPGAMIDLGAVGKGFALDRASQILREHGVTNAFLHGGTSSVVALGKPDGADGWLITVGPDRHRLSLLLTDRCLAVSSPGGRPSSCPESDSAPHIIDPRTGAPSRGVDAAAVSGPLGSAAACDAWATALVVLGSRSDVMDHPPRFPRMLDGRVYTAAEGWQAVVGAANPTPNLCPC
ncbi:MAG: FAD:protein FMN transferase [Phycisphaerales bacterium]